MPNLNDPTFKRKIKQLVIAARERVIKETKRLANEFEDLLNQFDQIDGADKTKLYKAIIALNQELGKGLTLGVSLEKKLNAVAAETDIPQKLEHIQRNSLFNWLKN